MDAAAQVYIDAIAPEHRALFDRVHGLIVGLHPDAEVVFSYKMPTYVVGDRRLYVGAWKHGLSIYGWQADHDGGFAARHSELVGSKGTIKLSPTDAALISDDDLASLISGGLSA